MKQFLINLIPRFCTEYIAYKELGVSEDGELSIAPIARVQDLNDWEEYDYVMLMKYFNLFGNAIFVKNADVNIFTREKWEELGGINEDF